MTNEELKQFISAYITEVVFDPENPGQFLNAIIPADKIFPLAEELKANPITDFDYLFCISGVDWKDYFFVVYHLQSRKYKHILVLKAKIYDRTHPEIRSVSGLWKTAIMQEREVYDLFGIKFNNHPDLRRLFLDDTWGFPLRKDYADDITIVSL